jgi:hypothetical protein
MSTVSISPEIVLVKAVSAVVESVIVPEGTSPRRRVFPSEPEMVLVKGEST